MSKINILFNADVLTRKFNKTVFCSDVFFAAYNCLQTLSQNKCFISEEQCIEAFKKLYFHEDIRKEYIAKGIERAKLFSWEKTVDTMTEVMLNTINGKEDFMYKKEGNP
ncbi:MAG: hypothetical protein LBU17_11430 [Treponema sp.]|jgi:hypothetical protein|nr:hypothetical protein [Treponema sp.]